MPSLLKLLEEFHFSSKEICFIEGIIDRILEINLKEQRGANLEDVQNFFISKSNGQFIYNECFIKETLKNCTRTIPQILCETDNSWYSVTILT